MQKYDQLTQDKRYHMAALKKTGANQSTIADKIGVNKSTVSREFRRNRGAHGYNPKQAQALSDERKRNAVKNIKMTSDLKENIDKKLREDWSPDQISGYLSKDDDFSISHETIYQPTLCTLFSLPQTPSFIHSLKLI